MSDLFNYVDENYKSYETILSDAVELIRRNKNILKCFNDVFAATQKIICDFDQDLQGVILKNLDNDGRGGQIKNVLLLITLIQLDDSWVEDENEIVNQSEQKCDENSCSCAVFMENLIEKMQKWNANRTTKPLMKFSKDQGFVRNFEEKISTLEGGGKEILDEISSFLDSFSEKYEGKIGEELHCSCASYDNPTCCKMKSKYAKEYGFQNIFCEIVMKITKQMAEDLKNKVPETEMKVMLSENQKMSVLEIERKNSGKETTSRSDSDAQSLLVIDAESVMVYDDKNVEGEELKTDDTVLEICKSDERLVKLERSSEEKSTETDRSEQSFVCTKCKGRVEVESKPIEEEADEKLKLSGTKSSIKLDKGFIELYEPDGKQKMSKIYGLLVTSKLSNNLIIVKWIIPKFHNVKEYELYSEKNFLGKMQCPSQGLMFVKSGGPGLTLNRIYSE